MHSCTDTGVHKGEWAATCPLTPPAAAQDAADGGCSFHGLRPAGLGKSPWIKSGRLEAPVQEEGKNYLLKREDETSRPELSVCPAQKGIRAPVVVFWGNFCPSWDLMPPQLKKKKRLPSSRQPSSLRKTHCSQPCTSAVTGTAVTEPPAAKPFKLNVAHKTTHA